MSRETRLVVILFVIGAAGIAGLAMVADRYRTALAVDAATGASPSQDRAARAVRLVGGFLAARKRGLAKLRQADAGAADADRAEMNSTLAAYGMTYEDYAAVRTAWRSWKRGEPPAEPELAAVFAARRVALEQVELGQNEAVDDAIKSSVPPRRPFCAPRGSPGAWRRRRVCGRERRGRS